MVDLRLFFSPVPHYRETYFAANNNDGDVIGDRCREEAEVNSIEVMEWLDLPINIIMLTMTIETSIQVFMNVKTS